MSILHIKEIEICDKKVSLEKDSIICFVGENNAGKTASLNSIYEKIRGIPFVNSPVKSIELIFQSPDSDGLKIEDFYEITDHSVSSKRNKTSTSGGNIGKNIADNMQKGHGLNIDFVRKIDIDSRQKAVENGAMIKDGTELPQSPMQHLAHDSKTELELSKYTKNLFGFDLSICAGAVKNMTLHIGNRIDATPYGGDRSQSYFNEVAKLPRISEQGDGTRCTVGLIASCITKDGFMYIFDEPDLYLHPPQAYETARTMAQILDGKQIFIATHSTKFIQGLVDESKDRIKVIRLSREEGFSKVEIINNEVFSDVKSDPILSFTNILDAFFHSRIIFCEDEADCLFFRASISRINGRDFWKNSLWLGVNGKGAYKKAAKIAKDMCVPFSIIADFDFIKDFEKDLRPVLDILEAREVEHIAGEVASIVKIESNDSKFTWKSLKENGLKAVIHNQDLYERIKKLIEALYRNGICIVPFGEVESLREPRTAKKGVEALTSMLNENIEENQEFDNLRRFCKFLKNSSL